MEGLTSVCLSVCRVVAGNSVQCCSFIFRGNIKWRQTLCGHIHLTLNTDVECTFQESSSRHTDEEEDGINAEKEHSECLCQLLDWCRGLESTSSVLNSKLKEEKSFLIFVTAIC